MEWLCKICLFVLIIGHALISCKEAIQQVNSRSKRSDTDSYGKIAIQSNRRNIVSGTINNTASIVVGDRFSGVLGKRVEISCPFYGDPHPRAAWFFKGIVIDHIKFANLDITEPNGVSVLTIIKLDQYHVGDYTCMVFNQHGRRSSTAYVRVIVPGQPTIFSERYSKVLDVNEKVANVSIGTNITVFQGSKIIFWCDVRAELKLFQIKWASPPTANKKNQISKIDSILALNDVTETENGYYYCNVNDKNGAADQQRSTVTVIRKVPPSIQSRSDKLRYIRGSGEAPMVIGDSAIIRAGFKVKISCPFTAIPIGKVSWLKNGMELALPSGNLKLDKERNTLIIDDIETKHSDVYSCMVENILGKKVVSSNITVIPIKSAQPRIAGGNHRHLVNIDSTIGITTVKIGETVRIINGAALRLKCDASGVPKPSIEWTLNRKPIQDDLIVQSYNELLILDFTERHTGDYKCAAKNIIGQARAWSDVRIVVSEAPTIQSSDSYYKISDQSTLVKLIIGDTLKTSGGRDIEIKCPVKGHPVAEPLWKHGDKMLEPSKSIEIDKKRKTLLLKDVDEWETGTYSCFAANGAGVAVSTTHLKILPRGSPVITSKKNVLRILDQTKKFVDIDIGTNLTTTTRKNLRIVCPSVGFDNANIEWTINDKHLRYDTRILLSNGNELIINDLQFFDNGIYKCRVYSQFGFDIMASKIEIIGSLNDPDKDASEGDSSISKTPKYAGNTGIVKTISGNDVTVISGQNIQIHCPTRGTLRPVLTWFKDNVAIQPSNRLIPRGEMLLLNEVSLETGGEYTCRMTTEIGTKVTNTIVKVLEYKHIQIKKGSGRARAVDFKKELRVFIGTDIFTIPGVTIKIKCPYVALPKAEIFWYFNSDKIVDDKRFNQDKLTDALIIPKITAKDMGTYTCHAVQGDRTEEARSQIRLLSMKPAKISESSRKVSSKPSYNDLIYMKVGDSLVANLGKRVQIDCHATGLPTPKFIWKFNGKSLKEAQHTVNFQNGSILVQRITWKHEGRFECFAINNLGVDSVSTDVKVYGPYVPTNYVPVKKTMQVTQQTSRTTSVDIGTTITLRSGNNLIIKCPVRIFGQVDTFWQKDDEVFTGTRAHADGSVFIRKIMPNDAGEYVCFSEDEARVKFGVVTLKVVAPIHDLVATKKSEEVEFYLPQRHVLNVELGGKVSILRGNLVRFSCPIVEKANVDIQWYNNLDQVYDGERYHIAGRTLQLKDSSVIGTYNITCQIYGPIGSTTVTSQLVIVAPTNINVVKITQDIVSTKSQTKVDVGGKVFVLDGSSVDLTCPVSSIPPPKILWKRDGRRIFDGTGLYMKRQGFILSIPFIRRRTAGKYTCIASNEFGGEVEATMELGVYVPKRPTIVTNRNSAGKLSGTKFADEASKLPPKFIATDKKEYSDYIGQDYKILSGPDFNLVCDAAGEPKPTIRWRVNGNQIAASSGSYLIQTRDLNESGYYTCIATNAFGSVAKSSSVVILAPSKPIIQRDPNHINKTEILSQVSGTTKVEILIGDDLKTLTETDVYISCPAIGIPRPKISFLKDGKLLKASNRVLINSLGSLTLKPASKNYSSDGVYTCRAENAGGHQELNTTLKLYNPAKPEFLRPVTKPQYSYNPKTKEGQLYLSIGQNTRAYSNTIVIVKCPVAGFPFPIVMWEKDGKPISPGGVAVLKDNATTLAYKFDEAEGAVFTCVAANVAGTSQMKSIINRAETLPARILAPRFRKITARKRETNMTVGMNVNIMSGATLRIICPVLGEPKPTITWIHENRVKGSLEKNPNVHFSSTGLEITLTKITKKLSGIFKCVAENPFGSDQKKTYVKVIDSSVPRINLNKHKIVGRPSMRELSVAVGGELYAHKNTRVIIHCPVRGFPPPVIKWFKDNKPLEKQRSTSRKLILDQIKIENEGVYRCTASNFLKTVQAESRIYVGFAPEIAVVSPGVSPIISSTANSEVNIPIGVRYTYIRLGSTAVFRCHAEGHPTPKHTWKFNGRPVNTSNVPKYESLVPSVLEVRNLTIKDQGVYSCEVKNMYGKMRRRSELMMMEPPIIQSDRTNISITVWSRNRNIQASVGGAITIVRGMSLTIGCPTIGIPTPRITWKKINSTYQLDRRIYLTQKNELTIRDARTSDSGAYECKAENKVGRASSSSSLIVAERPAAVVYPDFRRSEKGRTALVSIGRRKLVIPKGKLIRLMCHIRGSPTPKVTWLKDNSIVRKTSRHHINGQQLIIESARESDIGTYVCIAENVMGATTALTQISIGAKPVIDRITKRNSTGKIVALNIGTSINVNVGSTVRIYCKVSGLPSPSIMWTVTKERNRRIERTRLKSDEYDVLTLRDVTRLDQGVYSCEVENYIGKDKAATNISLLDPATITSQVNLKRWQTERLFMFNSSNVAHVVEGEAVRLVCPGVGYPTPNISFVWKPKSLEGYAEFVKQFSPFGRNERMKSLNDETLKEVDASEEVAIIDNFRQMRRLIRIRLHGADRFVSIGQLYSDRISVQTSGLYTCRTSNKGGNDEKSMNLYVHPKPEPSYSGTWVALGYGTCSSPCSRSNFGVQTRKVYCMGYGGRTLPDARCNRYKKPLTSKECASTECTTQWQPGTWSECSRTCGGDGYQVRSPYCTYSKSKMKISPDNCPMETKPAVRRRCNAYPCSEWQCVDRYRYCKMITGMGFCEVQTYKTFCCKSCVREKGAWDNAYRTQ